MKSLLRTITLTLTSLGAVTSVVLHPYGAVKAANTSGAVLAGANLDRDVAAIFERSCQNCHSDRTEWPWYSYVAPASVMIESDVAKARSRMNLSHWDEYSPEEQQALLIAISGTVRTREMPPSTYTLLHGGAKLSVADCERIVQWAKAERQRVKNSARSTESGG